MCQALARGLLIGFVSTGDDARDGMMNMDNQQQWPSPKSFGAIASFLESIGAFPKERRKPVVVSESPQSTQDIYWASMTPERRQKARFAFKWDGPDENVQAFAMRTGM